MANPKTTDQSSIASEYIAAGLSVIPLRLDGSKAPGVPSWGQYQKRQATPQELSQWFSRQAGIGIIAGEVSGNLEVMDFDGDADRIFPAWRESLSASVRAKLSVVETGGLGYHVLYRCDQIEGNQKIAQPADTSGKVFIETRGEGGYVVGVGSPLEVHASGNPYVQTHGPVLPTINTITADDRWEMWTAAQAFDEQSATTWLLERSERISRGIRLPTNVPSNETDLATWDDFKQRATWHEVLCPHGWTSPDGDHWTRPGKSQGLSARVGKAADGTSILAVWSSNAGPLSPRIGSDKRELNKFEVYKLLNHFGDASAAAKDTYSRGYGSRHDKATSDQIAEGLPAKHV